MTENSNMRWVSLGQNCFIYVLLSSGLVSICMCQIHVSERTTVTHGPYSGSNGTMSLQDIKTTILGRCEDYQHNLNPEFMDKSCCSSGFYNT